MDVVWNILGLIWCVKCDVGMFFYLISKAGQSRPDATIFRTNFKPVPMVIMSQVYHVHIFVFFKSTFINNENGTRKMTSHILEL